MFTPAAFEVPELRDRKDLPVLAAAGAAAADVIISGDKDLLVLKSFHTISTPIPAFSSVTLSIRERPPAARVIGRTSARTVVLSPTAAQQAILFRLIPTTLLICFCMID